ncbi:hypothetical protein RSAG8_01915, partial [Rhizoctonia solani AG-8 WAC10335]
MRMTRTRSGATALEPRPQQAPLRSTPQIPNPDQQTSPSLHPSYLLLRPLFTMVRWAYFVTNEDIVVLHEKRGGTLGTFNPLDPWDVDCARRFIFRYLLPGPVRVWHASLDGNLGVVFFVGKPVREPRQAFKPQFASRCYRMFGRSPEPCMVKPNSLDLKWELRSRDKSTHELELMEYLGSDLHGDMYPMTEGEMDILSSRNK